MSAQPLNEWACRSCGTHIVAAWPICPACATKVRRLNEARALLAQADAALEPRFPPPRPRPFWVTR